jgi:hypothetical protein
MEVKIEAKINQPRNTDGKLDAKTNANNEKFEALRVTLISRMDNHQARIGSTQGEIKAKMDIHKEGWKLKWMLSWRK